MSCNDPDHMEMPCLCDCGSWFELNDGYMSERRQSHGGNLVCPDCHEDERDAARKESASENPDWIVY